MTKTLKIKTFFTGSLTKRCAF